MNSDADAPLQEVRRERSADRYAVHKLVATMLGVGVTIASLIWGAAKISNSVDNMNLAISDLKIVTDNLRNTIVSILVDQARLDAELQALKLRKP